MVADLANLTRDNFIDNLVSSRFYHYFGTKPEEVANLILYLKRNKKIREFNFKDKTETYRDIKFKDIIFV